jgi:hypothetical protein
MKKEEIVNLEKKLLDPVVRSDVGILDQLIDDEFVEYGTSGQTYSKADVLELLPKEPHFEIEGYDFELIPLSEHVGLLRFKTRRKIDSGSVSISLRSSIWRRTDKGWSLLFHQGTRANL